MIGRAMPPVDLSVWQWPGSCPLCETRSASRPTAYRGAYLSPCCSRPLPAAFLLRGVELGEEQRARDLAYAENLKRAYRGG